MRVLTAKIRNLEEQLHTLTETYLQGIGNQVSSMDATLGTFTHQLSAIPRKQLEYARRQRQVETLEAAREQLETKLNEAEIAEAVEEGSVTILDTALTPGAPSSPNPPINLAAGVAVGLMLGIGLACIREYRDRSVHSRRDVLVATGVPVLGLIPRVPRGRERVALITGRRKLNTGYQPAHPRATSNGQRNKRTFTFLGSGPQSPETHVSVAGHDSQGNPPATQLELTVSRWTNIAAEAYSLLVTNISFARTHPPTKVVVITSPVAAEGKTTCAANLAITLTLRGAKVLLVDADLRRGVIHTLLGAERSPGLSEVLARPLPVRDAVRSIKVGDEGALLHFLPTGRVPSNPSSLLESPAFEAMLQQLKDEYDIIILDAPPVNIISDASILGLNADAVLMVARSGVTDATALRYGVEQLTRVGVPLLGVVLNDIDFKREALYDPSYRAYTANPYAGSAGESG
jgi:capsular exopolysaccharide synthesis family protein